MVPGEGPFGQDQKQPVEDKGKQLLAVLVLGRGGKLKLEKVETSQDTGGQEKFGDCPVCKSPIVEGNKGYGCCNWRNGCRFIIWKQVAQRPISADEARTLLEKGVTEPLDGFKSKAGKDFSAKLKIQGDKVQFDFN